MRPLPMFPLGTVLFPRMVLPLYVFEQRYRALVEDVLPGERSFGVTLIERGPEVGGGETRTDVGTIARIIQAEELEDGRSLLVTVGTRRIRVERWLPDAPYPRAEVTELHDDHDDDTVSALWPEVASRLRRVLAMRTELGQDGVSPTVELSDEPGVACWQGPALAPLTASDAQQLLTTDACDTRLERTAELLDERMEHYDFLLRSEP